MSTLNTLRVQWNDRAEKKSEKFGISGTSVVYVPHYIWFFFSLLIIRTGQKVLKENRLLTKQDEI